MPTGFKPSPWSRGSRSKYVGRRFLGLATGWPVPGSAPSRHFGAFVGLGGHSGGSPGRSTFDRKGRLITTFFTDHRIMIDSSQIPPTVPMAFIAIEDNHFYDHPGIDISAILQFANFREIYPNGKYQARKQTCQYSANKHPKNVKFASPLFKEKIFSNYVRYIR